MATRASVPALALAAALFPGPVRADLAAQIDAVKPSVVVVGYSKATNSPRFALSGTGFAVGDGSLLITNAHVLGEPDKLDPDAQLQVLVRHGAQLEPRNASVVELDRLHDLALLRIAGAPLPALKLRESGSAVREGQSVALMGFPIGGVLGYSPVTHRGIVSSITPITLPTPSARVLDAKNILSVRNGVFDVIQLDATSYPGNSGGPLFDADTGEVLGVVNMTFVKGTRESVLTNPSGISYAIPATYVIELLKRQGK